MNKRLLILMVSLLLCGTLSAQNGWNTDPNSHSWSGNTPIVATVQINGILQEDLNNLTLGAFAGDELRGRANVANTSVYDGQFWIQVYYNTGTTEAISFKLYDAATETEYPACAVTKPTQDEGWGTPANPVELNFTATQTQTQTIALTSGTNWFSTYVDITLDDLKAALVAALPNTVIRIKNETQTTLYSRGSWNGNLDWDVAKMYMIVVTAPCELSFEGSPIEPTEHTITILGNGNATWIGYPFSEGTTVTSAFASIVLNGDRVKSVDGNSLFSRGSWNGSVGTIDPGQGYIYVSSSSASDRLLIYPTPTQK